MASALPAPLASAAAMFNCCSMMAAAMAPKAMTTEMIWRCRDDVSNWMASAPLTPPFSPVVPASPWPAPFSRLTRMMTMSRQTAMMPALTSSMFSVPTRSTR